MDCRHNAWVQISGSRQNCDIIDTGQYKRLFTALPQPEVQTPSKILYVGKRAKDQALAHIHPYNRSRRSKPEGIARLRIDNARLHHNYPIFFADTDLSYKPLDRPAYHHCHHETPLHVDWAVSDLDVIADHLFARAIVASSDLVVLFADDFDDLEELGTMLVRWISIGVMSDIPKSCHPRLLLAVTEWRHSRDTVRSLYADLERRTGGRLRELFVQVMTFYMNDEISALSMFGALRDEIFKQLDEIRHTLISNNWLFSATHDAALFSHRMRHIAKTPLSTMHTAQTACGSVTARDQLTTHIENFVSFAFRTSMASDVLTSYLAACLLADAYPPGSHVFDSDFIFDRLYAVPCKDAFRKVYSNDVLVGLSCLKIKQYIKEHLSALMATRGDAATLRHDIVTTQAQRMCGFRSTTTCICLRHSPQYVLKCKHAFCAQCVAVIGTNIQGREYTYRMCCPICVNSVGHVISLKPPTAGVRIMSIDGGGIAGIIPLRFLSRLQSVLGHEPIQNFFDLACGTSSGGLTILALFLCDWSVAESRQKFEELATQMFRDQDVPRGIINRLRTYVRWMADGKYDRQCIDAVQQEAFGTDRGIFDCSTSRTYGAKVAVTAATAPDPNCLLLTNYNVDATRPDNIAYGAMPPGGINMWQAARATSAAPMYFPPISINDVLLQDGGITYNNPVQLPIWDSRFIWDPATVHDVVLSLGTGYIDQASTKFKLFQRLETSSLIRGLKAFSSLLDGQRTWEKMLNGVHVRERNRYARLNVELSDTTTIDDLTCIGQLESRVDSMPNADRMYIGAVIPMLTAAFFFELDRRPCFESGMFRCEGTIFCRNDIHVVRDVLTKLCGPSLEFHDERGYLTSLGGEEAVCASCTRWSRCVTLYVGHLDDEVGLYVRSSEALRWHISGFPQRVSWFMKQQHLFSAFGSSDAIRGAQGCSACVRPKRKTVRTAPTRAKRQCR